MELTTTGGPRFSLVIPARNEESLLPRLLDSVDVARRRYRGGPGAVEVIVADNASTDRTAEIADGRGCRVARVEKRAIAAARNSGARIARGEVLCFVDADFSIHPETFNEIDAAISRPRTVGGATGCTMERLSAGILLTYLTMLPVVWTSRFDTGVVFCKRADFEAIGGYDESMRFAEDVRFLLDVRALGRKRRPRQRLVRVRRAKAVASARKFDTHGDWHYFRLVPRLLYWTVFARRSMDAWASMYWYEDRG
jgi:glycosyltransferase involved in cell wall biosynthesis